MNILFITSTLPRYTDDGQAPFVLEQALAWKEGFTEDKIFVLAPHDNLAKTDEVIEGVTVRRFRYWWPVSHQKLAYPAILPNIQKRFWLVLQLPALMLFEFLAARRFIREQNIEYVFAHWVMPQGVIAYFLHRLLGIPYGLKNYSSDLRVFNRIPIFGPLLARHVIGSSTRLICENSVLRQEAIDIFPLSKQSLAENKIVALAMGVFHELKEQFSTDAEQATHEFGFIGRLSRKKGVDCFLRALDLLHDRGVKFKAHIAGTGEEESALINFCDLPEIEFLGHVSGKQKEQFFRQSRFLVFPSRQIGEDIEGLSVALLEALYLGKIVIASRATNIQLLPEWEAIRARVFLLNDPQDASEFVELLSSLLSLSTQAVNDIVGPSQTITGGFGWKNRIREYRQLLV